MKKILSIMLVFLMMICFLPTNIYASDDTVDIGNLTFDTYDQLQTKLGSVADVSKENSHINIKLNKNIKGRLNFDIQDAYIVFDANGKTVDGAGQLEALCLEHGSAITMVLKGNGIYKHGINYAIFGGTSNDVGKKCKYIILSAKLEGSIGCNDSIDVVTQLEDGYEYYTATKDGQNLFEAQNTTEKELTVTTNDYYSKDVYVFEQHGTHQHVYNQEVESSKYVKQAATCVTPGIYYKSCTCGAKSDSEFDTFTTGHLGHDYTVQVKKEAYLKSKAKDCTERDVYWYICSRCGKASTTLSYTDLDSKVEHVSSDWIVDKEATTESEGSKHKECTVCKEVLETEKIAKLENKETLTPIIKKKKIEAKATKAVRTGDNTNIIGVVTLLVCSLAILTLVRKYC